MKKKKSKKELLKDLKVMDQYDQAQDLDGGMSSWTYNMGELNTGSAVTTTTIPPYDNETGLSMADGEIDKGLDVKFDVSDSLYQPSFDFDHDLRKKYPALKDAYEHYQNVKQMCETREKEEDAD